MYTAHHTSILTVISIILTKFLLHSCLELIQTKFGAYIRQMRNAAGKKLRWFW